MAADYPRCPFEKAILSTRCGCELALRTAIGERVGVHCRSDIARNNCSMLQQLLRQKSRFALKVTDTAERMPFGKEMKVMLGGLEGLAQALNETGVIAPGENIHALVAQAQQHFGGLTSLPYDRIIRSITACQVRRRGPPDSAK